MSARSNSLPVSGLVLQEKEKLGWVDRWKAQNNVKFKIVSGEAKLCTPEMTAH